MEGWGGGGAEIGSGVLSAGSQVAPSSAAGGRCGVPGRPDIGGGGSCFVSLCTSWSKPRLGALGVLKSGRASPALLRAACGNGECLYMARAGGALWGHQGQDGHFSVPPAPLTAA